MWTLSLSPLARLRLILLSDIDGLYTADPRSDSTAKHLPLIKTLTDEIMAMGGGVNAAAAVGSGGMATKLAAAKIATQAGCRMCIMDGRDFSPLTRLENGARSSWFEAELTTPMTPRKSLG